MNTIGADTVQMLQAGLTEAAANFTALVVGNDAPEFSVGANLMLGLLEAQEGNWDEIDLMVRGFQGITQAIRYAPIPVVVATAGMTLGGGGEMALHADRVQPAGEADMGGGEVGVGRIPAGGGTVEMLARAVERAPNAKTDLAPFVQPVFETIAFGKVSTSAAEARQFGYLRGFDGTTMNRERLMADAKALALDRVREGYQPPAKRTAILVGGDGLLATLKLGIHLAWRGGRISDYDALIGRTLARTRRRRASISNDRERGLPARPGAGSVPAPCGERKRGADAAHAQDRQDAEKLMAPPPLVLIPGIQGDGIHAPRCDALAPPCRVLTFSLDEVDASRGFNRDKGLTATWITSSRCSTP